MRHRYHEILRGIDWSAAPALDGYVATTPKKSAETLLLSHHQDPVLSVWRYGLGRAAAFTSEVKARWGARWLQWDELNRLLAQLVRWTLRRFENEGEFLGRLQHPGIAQIFESGRIESEHGFQPYLAMELVRGEPLTASILLGSALVIGGVILVGI